MHENIIIIKSKKLDLEETCNVIGEDLLNRGECDYYTAPNKAAGPKIEGQIVMDLKKFYDYFVNELQDSYKNYCQSFYVLTGDGDDIYQVDWEEQFIRNEFWSLQNDKLEWMRQELLEKQSELMKAYLELKMKDLLKRVDEFEVCYLDIHH